MAKHFAQFYYRPVHIVDGQPKPAAGYEECLGSDGIMYMDNRWSLARMKNEAMNLARKRRHLKQIDGFRIGRMSAMGHGLRDPFFLTAAVIPIT